MPRNPDGLPAARWQTVEYDNGHRNQQRYRSVIRGNRYETRVDTRRDPTCLCLACRRRCLGETTKKEEVNEKQ